MHIARLDRFFALVVVLSSVACGGGDADPAASVRVRASALEASSLDGPGSTQLDIPAGATSVDVTIVLSAPRGRRPAPAGTTSVATPLRLEPEGQMFDKPLELTIPISPSALPEGKTLDDVVVVRAPQGGDTFVPLPTRRVGNAVVAQTEHFSDFLAVVIDSPANSPFGACLDEICAPTESCTDCPTDCGVCLPSSDTTPPTVTALIAPVATTNVRADTGITFDFDEAVMPASVSSLSVVVTAGGAPVAGILAVAGQHVMFTPAARLSPQTMYVLTVDGVRDVAGNVMIAKFDATFTTAAASSLLMASPAQGATGVSQYFSFDLSFSQPLAAATLSVQAVEGPCTGTVQLSYDGFASCTSAAIDLPATGGNTLSVVPALPPPGNATVSLRFLAGAEDGSGFSLAPLPQLTFTIGPDTSGPSLKSMAPSSGSSEISVNTNIVFTFDEPVNPATVNTGTIDISQFESTVPGSFAVSGRVVTWTPMSPLQVDASVDILFYSVEDTLGNVMSDSGFYGFHTTSRPHVVDSIPPAYWSGAHPRQDVTLTFSRAISAGTFSMQTADSTTCTGTVQLSDGTTCYGGTLSPGPSSVTIQAQTSLPLSANMTVTITPAATDTNGLGFNGGAALSFRVSPINAFTYGITEWGSLDGNLGGILGADAYCDSSGRGLRKAFLMSSQRYACSTADCVGTTGPLDWVLATATTYTDGAGNVLFTTDATNPIFTAWPMPQMYSGSMASFWFGGVDTWTSSGDDCNGWTDNTVTTLGSTGYTSTAAATFLNNGSLSCDVARPFLCVEQPLAVTPNLH